MPYRRVGFSLAEVLVTLGVIAVVAAFTIPTLIQSYQEDVYISEFKETYSMLQQAYIQAAHENGTADTWAYGEVWNNLRPYLKIQKDYAAIAEAEHWEYPFYDDYRAKQKDLYGNINHQYLRYQLILVNGATLYIHEYYSNAWQITVDMNGLKPPNQVGYDIFILALSQKNGAPIVDGPYRDWLDISSDQCRKSSASTGWINGGACAWWILKHWNMDYLHRDIPDAEWRK